MHRFITFSWEIDLLTSTSCATGSFTRMAFFFFLFVGRVLFSFLFSYFIFVHIFVFQGTITNILEENVLQPLLVSTSAIQLASETVRSILKIDDIVSINNYHW